MRDKLLAAKRLQNKNPDWTLDRNFDTFPLTLLAGTGALYAIVRRQAGSQYSLKMTKALHYHCFLGFWIGIRLAEA